jgi:hypothetical protein
MARPFRIEYLGVVFHITSRDKKDKKIIDAVQKYGYTQ